MTRHLTESVKTTRGNSVWLDAVVLAKYHCFPWWPAQVVRSGESYPDCDNCWTRGLMVHCRFLGEENKTRWVHRDKVTLYENELYSKVRVTNIMEAAYNRGVLEAIELINATD